MIVIKRKDGGVSLMRLTNGASVSHEIEKWKGVHPGEYVSHREVPDSEVPSERSAREAWREKQ